MTKNIESAFDAAQKMMEDCQSKIDELVALKEIYEKLGKSYEVVDEAVDDFRKFISTANDLNCEIPIRGIFSLAKEYPTVYEIERQIDQYVEVGNHWAKIRDILGQE